MRTITGVLLALLTALSATLAAGCASTDETTPPPDDSQPKITGTVSYRERIALPPEAVVYVRLVDVTLDSTPTVIAELRIADPGQPPIAFELPFNARFIDPERSYEVMARIEVDDEIIFLAPGSDPVLTRGGGAFVAVTAQMIHRGPP
jgi:putative lipoprotein